jgi:AcrR family transcriptional regulator
MAQRVAAAGGSRGKARRARRATGAAAGGTRERLLDVAVPLFAARGFYGTSLRDIGGELGLANASLLYHYPSKSRLYGAVLARIAEGLEGAYRAAAEASGDEAARLEALCDGLVDWTLAEPDHARIVMRELIDNQGRAERVERWYFAEVLERMAGLIAAGQERGLFAPCEPMLFLFHMVGSISYFFAGLPTIAAIMESEPETLSRTYRAELRRHLMGALRAVPS